jgi:hypothetical protein
MKAKKVTEKWLQKTLFSEVRKMGGLALKLASPYHNGQTDGLLIMPRGITWFVEVKTPGETLEPLQEVFRDDLLKRGHRYRFIDHSIALQVLINQLQSEI